MKEMITSAAIKIGGKTFTGSTHGRCGEQALEPGTFTPEERENLEWVRDAKYGFTTTANRFVTRTEAMQIALAACQVSDHYAGACYLESHMLKAYATFRGQS